MQILIDKNNVVTGVCTGNGRIDGGIPVDTIPDDFAPYRYVYSLGIWVLNPNYDAIILGTEKSTKIAESKEKLAEWLASNPMQFSDGKYYSVTEEKQALLNSNLASYERAMKAEIDYPLKWNCTGEECVSWEYADLLTLSLMIAGYVAPKVAAQQALEIQINACTTVEELDEVVIDYD